MNILYRPSVTRSYCNPSKNDRDSWVFSMVTIFPFIIYNFKKFCINLSNLVYVALCACTYGNVSKPIVLGPLRATVTLQASFRISPLGRFFPFSSFDTYMEGQIIVLLIYSIHILDSHEKTEI